jgi:hypothetical protein
MQREILADNASAEDYSIPLKLGVISKNPAYNVRPEAMRNDRHSLRVATKMDYRAMDDRIAPFRRVSLHKQGDAIREVILGPRNITPLFLVQECLRHHGWTNVIVRSSHASYR